MRDVKFPALQGSCPFFTLLSLHAHFFPQALDLASAEGLGRTGLAARIEAILGGKDAGHPQNTKANWIQVGWSAEENIKQIKTNDNNNNWAHQPITMHDRPEKRTHV